MDAYTHAPGTAGTGAPARNSTPRHDSARAGLGPDAGTMGQRTKPAHDTAGTGRVHSTGLAAPLLARLEGVRTAGPGRWHARCPAHQDRSPSLSIRETGERVLLHCFAGCDPSDILAAVGLAWRDLYPDKWDCARLRPNEGAARYARRTLAALDPLELDRLVLKIAAADQRAGRPQSIEDRARTELAVERLTAARTGGRS